MSTNNPKVCVVMPVYNGEATIKLALKSLLAQTYPNWECVIVNDGSTDSTRTILDSLTDHRFKVIHLPKNVGRGAARQVCLDNAEGEYLSFLDADDFYHSDKLRFQVEFLNRNPEFALVSTAVASYNSRFELISKKQPNKIEFFIFRPGDKIIFLPATVMLRLSKAKEVKYDNFSVSEDTRYFSRYLTNKQYCKLPYILYYYFEGNTTYRKIMSYQWGVLKIKVMDIMKNPILNTLQAIKEVFKFVIKGLIIPIIGREKFITKRGTKPDFNDIKIFNKELKQ